jgi:hypothetical protein
MVSTSAALHRPSYQDEEPTQLDLQPWHESSGTYEVDEVTVVGEPDRNLRHALARPRAERVASVPIETLPLPGGLRESMLPVGARPRGEEQVRVALVRVARDLARDYRVEYGCRLRTDAASVELLQRYLLLHTDRVLAGRHDPRTLAPAVARHGVVLGEILAHALDARWLDLSGSDPSAWRMFVPTAAFVAPVARVQRFLHRRQREQDLVGFFLELAR